MVSCRSLGDKLRNILATKTTLTARTVTERYNNVIYHKNYNFLDCDWFKKLLFSTNSLAKLLSDSLVLESLLSDS